MGRGRVPGERSVTAVAASPDLAASYDYCRNVTRTRARNFYYAFRLLDSPRRDSICAIYAFMRHCDDLSDEPGASPAEARRALEDWRKDLDAALSTYAPSNPLWPAFAHTVARHGIPRQYFHDMIDGVMSDLERQAVATFDELYRYCYQVASVAGLSLIHVLGFHSPDAPALAEKCGIAFQLTNIIRDVREDALNGRVYLPAEDLARFAVDPASLRAPVETAALRELLRMQAARARAYYRESRPLLDMVTPQCRPSLWALIEIYSRLLDRMDRRGFEVLGNRIRLSDFEKSRILARAAVRWTS